MSNKDKLKGEIMMWLALFGRDHVNLKQYEEKMSTTSYEFSNLLEAYGMFDKDEHEDDEFRVIDQTLRLNDRAIHFLENCDNFKQVG